MASPCRELMLSGSSSLLCGSLTKKMVYILTADFAHLKLGSIIFTCAPEEDNKKLVEPTCGSLDEIMCYLHIGQGFMCDFKFYV